MNHQGPVSGQPGGLISSTATYRAHIKSQQITGDVDLIIEREGLLVDSAFHSAYIPYDSIRTITSQNYRVLIFSEQGETVISRLGQADDWFFKELCEAFNLKVQTILQAKGPVLFEAKGPTYRYDGRQGQACVRIFSDAIMLLPPNMDARRIPLAFLSKLESVNFVLTLELIPDERYQLTKLGQQDGPFERIVQEELRKIRIRNAELVVALDPSLSRGQAIQASQLIPEGRAVLLTHLKGQFPSLVNILEDLLISGPVGDYYEEMKQVGDESGLAIGFKEFRGSLEEKPDEDGDEGEEHATDEEEPVEEEGSELQVPPWALWAAIPSKDHTKAIVEFAFPKEKAATYLFKVEKSFEHFLMVLNRAFEASGFQRELLFITDAQLREPAHVNDRMLLERTPFLGELRQLFAGRVIHRSIESWKASLMRQLG